MPDVPRDDSASVPSIPVPARQFRAHAVPAVGPPPMPGAGKLVLWVGLGCFTFFAVMGVLIGMGAFAIVSAVKSRPTAEVEPIPEQEFSDETAEPETPAGLPAPPLRLKRPPAPISKLGNNDLAQIDPRALLVAAQQLYEKGNYEAAVRCQYQSVIRNDEGRYNLACYYARAGDVNAALYWLQAGARDEESNAGWALQDSDLVLVRRDPRWPKLLAYLRAYERHWEKSGVSETTLVLPHDAAPSGPLPVFIGLHGLGGNAHGFVDAKSYQALADAMGAAFVGVSGTLPRGKHTFVWSEDPDRDQARIDAALKEVSDRLTPAEGKLVLFGFSQGALVAAEVALRQPERFAGAVAMSPGSAWNRPISAVTARPEHRRQGIVAVCGALESPKTVDKTKYCAEQYKTVGARVLLKLYPGMQVHRFPPDFVQRLPEWSQFILDPQAPVPAQ